MKLEDLRPPPSLDAINKRDKTIKAYVDAEFKRKFQKECQKRCMTESSVIMAALDEYFNPKQVVKYVQGSGILRIDREPKGSTATPIKKVHYGIVIKELKEKISKREALLKPVGSYDSEINFIKEEV